MRDTNTRPRNNIAPSWVVRHSPLLNSWCASRLNWNYNCNGTRVATRQTKSALRYTPVDGNSTVRRAMALLLIEPYAQTQRRDETLAFPHRLRATRELIRTLIAFNGAPLPNATPARLIPSNGSWIDSALRVACTARYFGKPQSGLGVYGLL